MKKTTITISYDEEKATTLKLYLEQRGLQIEDELTKTLDTLYNKVVPPGVREYLELRFGNPTPKSKSIKTKHLSPSVVGEKSQEANTDGNH